MASEDKLGVIADEIRKSNRDDAVLRILDADSVEDDGAQLRLTMERLTPEQRVALLDALFDGYCRACGNESSGVCHCENDE